MKGPFCRIVAVLLFVSFFLMFPKSALAAVVTWDGGGADGTCGGAVGDGNKWSCGLNWSTDSAPTSSDVATFNGTSTKAATIDAAFGGSVSGVDINTGYTGVITASRSLTIGTGDYDQADGTFTSGSQTIDFDDGFNLPGGIFNASSGTMTIAGQFTDGAGTFNHNSGTVTFDPSTLTTITITCGATTFNAVNITASYANQLFIVASGCTVPIAGTDPTLTGGTITNNGTISITGNPTFNIAYTSNTGAILSTTGTSMTISKNLTLTAGTFPSGIATLIMNAGNLDNSGSLLPNGIDLTLATISGGTVVLTCGTVTFDSVTITKHSGTVVTVGSTCVIPLAGTNPTVVGTLNNNGTVNVTGNMTATGYTANSGSELTSTGASLTIDSSLTLTAGTFPSGITTLSVGNDLINSGNLLPNNIALTLPGGGGTTNDLNCGTATFASIVISKDTGSSVVLGSDCTTGGLTTSGTGNGLSNPASARTVNITGNLSHQATGTSGGANLTLEFSGSAAQTLNIATGVFTHILRINKTGSNAAKLTSAYSTVSQTCTVVEGVFDTNGNSFDCGSTFTVQDGGALTLAGLEPMDIPTLDSGSTVTYKGDGDASADSFQIRDWTYKNLTAAFTDTNDTLSAPTADTLTTNEVGYWKMDEGSGTVADSSSNNNTATATNATFTATAPPIDGSDPYAMDFDGSGDYLDMGNNLNLAQNVGAFSIAAFIRKDSNSGTDQVFGLSTGDSTSDSRAALATNGDEIICSASAGDAEAVQTRQTSATNLWTGVWYHVICTIDYASDTITIYLNGVSQSATGTPSFTATATSDTASQRSSIGIDEDKVGNDFDGQIDEVRVYTKILSQNEIQAMSAGFTTLLVTSRTVSNNLTISSGTLVSPTTLNVGGNFDNSATFSHNSGTVTLNGTSGTKTLTSGATSFYDLTINDGGGTLTTQLEDALDVNNNLTITGGTLDTKSGENNQINVGGSWSNSDTFTARSGTVVLDGASQTVSGSTTFNSLTKNVTSAATLTLPAGSTQTIGGTMNLSGTSGNLLSLRSSSSPTQARIDPQSTRTISYLDVKDNYNTNSTFINTSGFNITNSLGNTGWNFTLPSATTPGSISQATDGSGYLTFSTTVSEPDLQNTRLKVEYSDDGGTSWYDPDLVSATPSTGSVNLDDAQTYQIGQSNPIDTFGGNITLTIVWDTMSASNGNGSLDNTDQADIQIRVTPSDFVADGSAAASASFEVDNLDPTTFSSFSAPSHTGSTVALDFSAVTESNFNHYEVWYGTDQSDVESRTGTATEWDDSDDSFLATISTTSTSVTGLSAGSLYYFRIWAVDDFGNESNSSTISDTPNTLSSATTPGSISQAADATGYVTFSTTVSDTDLQNTRLKVEYSDDGGTSWYDPDLISATPSTGSVNLDDSQTYQVGQSNAIDTSTGDITLTIVWDTQSSSNGNGSLDGTDQSDIRVRVTPSDFSEDGSVAGSTSFEVDNLDPSGLAGLAATSTATTATLTWTSASEANFNHYEIWYGTTQADVESRSGTAAEWDNDNDADLATVSTADTTISPLTNGLTYYFRIWAVDDFGNEAFAATISKLIISANFDPDAPTSLGGSNLVNGNWGSDSTPTLTFTLSDSDTGDTVKYRIQIDDSSDFSSAVVDYTSALAVQGSFSFTVGQAAGSGSYTTGSSGQTLSDGSYYWRVKTIDDSSAESASIQANSGAVAFRTDTSAPTQPSLDSPGDNSYTNSTRPGFRWKISTDTGSGLSSYSLEVDNGDSGDFSITGIPVSRTTDYETSTYLIKYEGFSDSDANNNYITVYTKSSVDWGGGNNNGLLKDGKRGWTVKAYDVAGAEASGSRNLFVDLTAPSINVTTVSSEPVASDMTVSDRNPILVGVASDPLGSAIASSPKKISISIDKIVVGKKTTTYQNVVSTTISVPKIYWSSDDSLITDNTQQKSAKYYPFSYKIAQKLALGNYRATIGGSDQAGNGASGQTFTFKILAESTATEIFGVRAIEIATNSAQIVWYTNHPATSKVNYGTSADYGKSVSSSLKIESHSMLLTGLSPGTGYYFEVISTGNTTASDSLNSFITLAFITPTPTSTPTPTATPTPEPTPDIIEDLITLISTPAADLITFVSTPAAILGSYISSASASFLPMVSGMTLTTLDLLEEVVEQIAAVREEIIASPPAAVAVETSSVVTTAAATIALVAIGVVAVHAGVVAATIVPPAASLILSPHLIQRFASGVQHFVATFFTGLGLIKRRRKSEGMVINAVDDTPIANANLLFYSPSGNLKITFTDSDGRFDVKAASDTYQIKAQKAGYVFPSLTLTTPENEKYAHIYRPGDNYEIVGEPLYEIAVPMDPQESPVAAVRMFLRVKNYLSYILIRYHLLISLTGAVSSGLGAWVYPSNLTYFSLVVYSIALVLSLRHSFVRETWGRVFDASGKPMVNMLLRLYRQLPDRLDLYTSLTTDKDGRYLITPEPGDYMLQVVDAHGKVVKSRSLIINPGHPRLDEKITVR